MVLFQVKAYIIASYILQRWYLLPQCGWMKSFREEASSGTGMNIFKIQQLKTLFTQQLKSYGKHIYSYDALMAHRFSENPSTMLIMTHLLIL